MKRRDRNKVIGSTAPERPHKESDDRHVHVEPGVEIDFVRDVKDRYEAVQKDGAASTKKQLYWTKIGAVLLLATAVFTFWQGYSARESVNASLESLKTARKQFELDQRPLVTDSCCVFAGPTGTPQVPTKIGQHFEVNVEFRNIGKTPAFNLIIHLHLLFGNAVVTEMRADQPDTQKSETILPPGDSIGGTAFSVKDTYNFNNAAVDPSSFVNWDGSQPVLVFGRITYDDRFGNHYCTPIAHTWFQCTTWALALGRTLLLPGNVRYKLPDMCPADIQY